MQNENSNGKLAFIFVSGVLLVGFLTYMLIRNTGTQEPDYEGKDKNLTSSLEDVNQQKPESLSDEDLTQEAFKQNNLKKEEKVMAPKIEGKMTVEQKQSVTKPEMTIDPEKAYTATLKTSMGDIVIDLDARNRPETVNSFVYLSKLGFYDGIIFHRIISGFMVQGGDPTGTGMSGPAYKFGDELSEPNKNDKGTISMANAGPDTNGSQFFINLVNNNFLDTKHSVFGKVTQGMEVVEAMGKVKTGANDRPEVPVVINSVTIAEQ